MQRVVESVLERLFGTYIDGLNREHLSISLRKGTIELRDLRLKLSALEGLNLPVVIKAGYLKTLNVQFKITQLGSSPVKILVSLLIYSLTSLLVAHILLTIQCCGLLYSWRTSTF